MDDELNENKHSAIDECESPNRSKFFISTPVSKITSTVSNFEDIEKFKERERK